MFLELLLAGAWVWMSQLTEVKLLVWETRHSLNANWASVHFRVDSFLPQVSSTLCAFLSCATPTWQVLARLFVSECGPVDRRSRYLRVAWEFIRSPKPGRLRLQRGLCKTGAKEHESCRAKIVRPVFKSSIWKNGLSPWDIRAFKGHLEVTISEGSGIRDPQFEVLRIEIVRTDRRMTELGAEG